MNLNFVASWTNGKYHYARPVSVDASANLLHEFRRIEREFEKDGWKAEVIAFCSSKREAESQSEEWNNVWKKDKVFGMPIDGKIWRGVENGRNTFAGEEQEESYRNKRRAVKEGKRPTKHLRKRVREDWDDDEDEYEEYEPILDRVMDRLRYWTDDATVTNLFWDMFSEMEAEGILTDDMDDDDIMELVDNAYVNGCEVIYPTEEDYPAYMRMYKTGNYDDKLGTIEAFNGREFLVSW